MCPTGLGGSINPEADTSAMGGVGGDHTQAWPLSGVVISSALPDMPSSLVLATPE